MVDKSGWHVERSGWAPCTTHSWLGDVCYRCDAVRTPGHPCGAGLSKAVEVRDVE